MGLRVGVAGWWIKDGLDWFVGSPVSLNLVVPLEYKQQAKHYKTAEKTRREIAIYSRARARR